MKHHQDGFLGMLYGIVGGTGAARLFLADLFSHPVFLQLSIIGAGAILSSGLGFVTTYILKKWFKDKSK